MNVETLEEMLKVENFRPFRVVLNSGRTVEVKHPEFVMLTLQGDMFVFRPSEQSETLAQAVDAIVALKNICQIEPLTAAA